MTEKLYCVAKNGFCGIQEFEIEKETEKTYILKQPARYRVVRKSQLNMRHVFFGVDKVAAEVYYDSIVHSKKRNIDRIRAMNAVELAEKLIDNIHDLPCCFCAEERDRSGLCDGKCVDGISKWLQQPERRADNATD